MPICPLCIRAIFQSTRSARSATLFRAEILDAIEISIHALREERDFSFRATKSPLPMNAAAFPSAVLELRPRHCPAFSGLHC